MQKGLQRILTGTPDLKGEAGLQVILFLGLIADLLVLKKRKLQCNNFVKNQTEDSWSTSLNLKNF